MDGTAQTHQTEKELTHRMMGEIQEMSEDQQKLVALLKKIFDQIDTDSSGYIDWAELEVFMLKLSQ